MNERAQQLMEEAGAPQLLLTSPVNIAYVSGFRGDESQLLLTHDGASLFTDSRYAEQAYRDLKGTQVEIVLTSGRERTTVLSDRINAAPGSVLGIEKGFMTVEEKEQLADRADIHSYVDISQLLLNMRSVKKPDEIERITTAAKATQDVLESVLDHIHAGVRECEIEAHLLYEIACRGMQSAFDPIVAAGANGSIPHARVTEYRLREGDLLTMDFGCRYEGYCADMTRTFAIGSIDDDLKTIYDIVEQAQKRALDAAGDGVRAAHVDAVAREWITDHGYGENFGHGTGHGVGLQIHELPIVNSSSTAVLVPGMVFTVEPGIYIPGRGGVRIEDTCVVCEGSLFSFPKTLIEL